METYQQVAALPYIYIEGKLSICLITSRETKRLIVPKGWPKAGISGEEMAYTEANEEAGLVGTISKHPIGSFEYKKKLHTFATVTCIVDVYPLKVTEQLIRYSEDNQRDIYWLTPEQAANNVEETELKQIINDFEKLMTPHKQKSDKKAKIKHSKSEKKQAS